MIVKLGVLLANQDGSKDVGIYKAHLKLDIAKPSNRLPLLRTIQKRSAIGESEMCASIAMARRSIRNTSPEVRKYCRPQT
jgi:hypothetical protein